jgi:hypothetical protein
MSPRRWYCLDDNLQKSHCFHRRAEAGRIETKRGWPLLHSSSGGGLAARIETKRGCFVLKWPKHLLLPDPRSQKNGDLFSTAQVLSRNGSGKSSVGRLSFEEKLLKTELATAMLVNNAMSSEITPRDPAAIEKFFRKNPNLKFVIYNVIYICKIDIYIVKYYLNIILILF